MKFLDLAELSAVRFLHYVQGQKFRAFPGSIRVGQAVVSHLVPLGGYHKPGVTKAGRLSFAGYCNDRKVKVYSVYSPAQIALCQAVQELSFEDCRFAELLAFDDELVVEAWVEGRSVAGLPAAEQRAAGARVQHLLNELHHGSTAMTIAAGHAQSFCYLQDYLLMRLGVWRHWSPVAGFLQRWQASYVEVRDRIPARLSHPDLSAANLVLESGSGRLVVIDNELLGVGHGWILDGRNSLLRTDLDSELPVDFIDLTWRLRQLGSALDANDFSKVQVLCAL